MGAWDIGIFDDDIAYDFVDEIKADPKAFFQSSFKTATTSAYLGCDDCHAVTVSAAYIDNLLNGTEYRTGCEDETDESNVNCFGKLHKDLKVDDLGLIAVSALEKVISDKSELCELWASNIKLYPKWKNNIELLIDRLR